MEAKKEIILSILNNKNQSFLASKIHAEICKNGWIVKILLSFVPVI